MTDYDDLAWNRIDGPWPRRPPDPQQVRQVMATWMNDLNSLENPVRNPDDIPRPTEPQSSSIAASVGCVIIVLALCATAIAITAIIVDARP